MRHTGQVQIHLPQASQLFTPAVTTLIVLSIAGSLAYHFATDFCIQWLILVPGRALRGYVWQFLTYPFCFHDPIWLLMDLAVILVVGSAVEREWGTKTFLLFWTVTSLVCGAFWALVTLLLHIPVPMLGSAACGYGLIFLFGELYHGRQFMLMMNVVDARVVSWLMLGIGALISAFAPTNLLYFFGVAVAWAFIKIREKLIYGEARSFNDGSYDDQGFVDIE